MIQEKITKIKAGLVTKQIEDAVEEDIMQQVNFFDIKLSDNRKRINKYPHNENSSFFCNDEQIVIEDIPKFDNIKESQINFRFSVRSFVNSNSSNSLY
jgi:hypothetical protein